MPCQYRQVQVWDKEESMRQRGLSAASAPGAPRVRVGMRVRRKVLAMCHLAARLLCDCYVIAV